MEKENKREKHKLYMREYRKIHSDRTEESRKRYFKNKESILKQTKEWSKENPEKRKQIRDKYRLNNPEKVRESSRNWTQRNKASCIANCAKRYACKTNSTPSWVNLKEIKKVYTLTKLYTEEKGEKFHVDHIVPLRGKNVCGLHVHWNLQILPAIENIKKGNKFSEDLW